MGLDSACIALRWLQEPASRDGIDLDTVTLTVAMTGDEYDETRRMMETHLLPRLREHSVRLVQLSRASQSGGYVVLDDSRSPRRMVMRGPWRLSDEFSGAGTLPQLSSHLCSIRSKAEPLEWWAADEYGDQPVFHIVGYAAEEDKRAAKDMKHASALRWPVYPLRSWGWDRARCEAYVRALIGERWGRSCCAECCFGFNKANLADLVARWRAEPELAAGVLLMEHTALALNERMRLYGKTSAHQLVREHGLTGALERYRARLEASRFAVYEVRRVLHAGKDGPHVKGPVWRSVKTVAAGSRAAMTGELAQRAAAAGGRVAFDQDGIARALVLARGTTYPTTERLFALAPVGTADKQLTTFDKHWTRVSAVRAERGDGG
ncbi:MAG TPA: hypothetical protein VL551_11825 [Actinospica sp.]|jgi:hypothetical protein|nr:hypothetical protein [Actinospica sp.]